MFTSLSGVICFFLFAVQLNSQYLLPADPSADAKDPVSIVARVSSSSLFGTEHLPVYKEEVSPVVYRTSVHREFAVPDQGLVVSDIRVTSPRGPPAA